MIDRLNCVVCQSEEIEHLHTFEQFPMYMGAKKTKSEYFFDQKWGICNDCGCIQLMELCDLKLLYETPHNPAVGRTWEKHNEEYCDFIIRNCGKSILEIGGGNGKLAKMVNKARNFEYFVCDKHKYQPNEEFVLIPEFFDLNYENTHTCDTIVTSHVVEHFYNPRKYFEKFYDLLPENGTVIFSFPNITNIIRDKFTNGLNFEHTYSINPEYLNFMMGECGFNLTQLKRFNNYNLFMAFKKRSKIKQEPIPTGYSSNMEIWEEFISHHERNCKYLKEQIYKYKNKFLFGCHVFSQYLLYFGLNDIDFLGIIDNDIMKQNHNLYGTNLKVYDSGVVENLSDVAVIVQAGVYTEEIIQKLKSFNKECVIIL
jgi:SAM-dependent methyltransferase